MIDIHCHILPGVDDGAKDWATTMAMCRIAKADGITHIVATPHANHRYSYDRHRYLDLLDELREKEPELKFSLGCDFHLSHENIQDALENPKRYVIGDSPYLLVEFSDYQTPHQMTDSLFRLHSAGFQTIVSHPERNPIIEQYLDLPEHFLEMGSALQITAGSLLGEWGRRASKTCERLLQKGLVSSIASDAHDSKRRTPVLSRARKAAARILGGSAAELLVEGNIALTSSYAVSASLATILN